MDIYNYKTRIHTIFFIWVIIYTLIIENKLEHSYKCNNKYTQTCVIFQYQFFNIQNELILCLKNTYQNELLVFDHKWIFYHSFLEWYPSQINASVTIHYQNWLFLGILCIVDHELSSNNIWMRNRPIHRFDQMLKIQYNKIFSKIYE